MPELRTADGVKYEYDEYELANHQTTATNRPLTLRSS